MMCLKAVARQRQKPEPFSSGLNSGGWVVLYGFRVVAMNQRLEPAGCVLSIVNMSTQKEATLCSHTEQREHHSQRSLLRSTQWATHETLPASSSASGRSCCDVAVPTALSAKIGCYGCEVQSFKQWMNKWSVR